MISERVAIWWNQDGKGRLSKVAKDRSFKSKSLSSLLGKLEGQVMIPKFIINANQTLT
jgi:hypothetical protein